MTVAAALAAVVCLFFAPGLVYATSGTVTYGCHPVTNDTSPWLSVSRGILTSLKEGPVIMQYWLSERFAYMTHTQQYIVSTMYWPLPGEVKPINGLVLSVNWTSYGFAQAARVLLQDAANCFYDYDLDTLHPNQTALRHKYCYDASLPVWQRIVPDNLADMAKVRRIYLASLSHVAVLSFNTTLPLTIIKIPEGDIPMSLLVGASYQSNPDSADELFVIRGNDSPNLPSEILNFVVTSTTNAPEDVTLEFGHVTYLDGRADSMFVNDNSTELLWTQVVPNWQGSNGPQGVLFDYSLRAPRFFRNGHLDFSRSPNMRWGTHAFSRAPGVDAMMITTTDQVNGPGFTVHVTYLDPSLPNLTFVDSLDVTDSSLPSLGQSIEFSDKWADFAVMMATHSAKNGYTCLQLFIHCVSDPVFCFGTLPIQIAKNGQFPIQP